MLLLEIGMILMIVDICKILRLKGKTFEQFTPAQQKYAGKFFAKYMKTRKGKKNPGMTINEYLPILQKIGLQYIIFVIFGLFIEACVIYFFFFWEL